MLFGFLTVALNIFIAPVMSGSCTREKDRLKRLERLFRRNLQTMLTFQTFFRGLCTGGLCGVCLCPARLRSQPASHHHLAMRPAFRIIRNFARLANDPEDDFKIVAEHLATRLGVTLQTACNIRLRFCDSGILGFEKRVKRPKQSIKSS
jgi:hypothetical protein